MTVEELILALMDMPKNAKVIVVEPSLRGVNIKNVDANSEAKQLFLMGADFITTDSIVELI